MTPTVLMEFGQQRPIKRGYEEMSFRGGAAAASSRGYAETVGESEVAAGSPVRVDSEDSSAPKRKCISLNSDGFDVKREIFVPSKMSSSERRYLRKRFRAELDSVRDLLKKPEFAVPVPISRAPALSSSAAPRAKKPHKPQRGGTNVIRGAKGRFLPTKPRPEPSTVLSEPAVFKQCETILKKLMTQKYSHIFNVPVDVVKLQIPDYFDIVKIPMDLGTVKKKLESGSYTSPSDFAADVRLTFNNAMAYNPRGHAVHDMAIQLNKMFESRWRPIEKKLASAATEKHVEVDRADSKRRKTPPVDRSDVSMDCVRQTEPEKPKMTAEEREAFGNSLASISDELPPHIFELLQQCIDSNTDMPGDGEIEIDIHAVSDDVLFELKKHVDKFLQEKEQSQQVKSEPSENEAVNVSGLSHSSTNPCKGGEPIEEDVDICGNASPIMLDKDAQIRSSKCGSPSSSSSDSESSSSDSDSGSDSESESEKVGSPGKLAKGSKKPDQLVEQEKSDVISPADDANRPADIVGIHGDDSESKPAPGGENSKPDTQVSPDRLLRAALLRSRYADVIVKARGILSQGGDKQEELEKLQMEEKARLLAEGNAALEARRAEAEAEAKRKRDFERPQTPSPTPCQAKPKPTTTNSTATEPTARTPFPPRLLPRSPSSPRARASPCAASGGGGDRGEAMTAKGGATPSPGGTGAAAGNGRLFTVGLVTAWYSSNIGVLLLNKYLLSNYGFKYPIFLTMCHMSACALLSYTAIAWLRVVPMQLVRSRVQLAKIAALSLVFCGSVVSGNVSLRYLPVSFNQAVGATTPFFTAVFAYIMTVKRESWVTYLTLVPVVTGVIIASGGEPSFHLFGFIMCIGATAARALKTVLQGILLSSEGEKLNSMNLLLYMAPIAVIFLLPATIFMEDNVVGVTIQLAKKDFTIVWLLLFNSCLAYFVNLTNFLVTKHTSALTLQVLGNAKGAVAVVVSIMIFRNPVSITGMLGYTLTVFGVILYSESKKRSNKP